MKKDSRQRLFEVMGKLDPKFKINESEDPCWDGYEQYGTKEKDGKEVPNCIPVNEDIRNDLSPKEQQIFSDIISVNESNNNWWNKFIQYGKRGLLTSAIIFALAFSPQAMAQNKSGDVIKAGIEMTDRNQEKDLLNFLIGFTTDEINRAKQTNNLDSYYYQGIESVRNYAINRKQSKESFLDTLGQSSLKELFNIHRELNKDEIMKYVEMGQQLNINEAVPDRANTDVQMLKNLKSPALADARQKIHDQQEFNDAFEYWFSTLGVAKEYKDRININSTLNHIRDVLEKFDVKY